jgi:sugar phosphate isomerase/epimerase
VLEIVQTGHFKDIGFCLDVGHANLGEGVPATLDTLKPLLRSSHLHDNNGERDEHLWPGEGNVAWEEVWDGLKSAPQAPAGVLEIHYSLGESPEAVAERASKTFENF